MSPPRVLIWVQHLLGTGHTVRAAAVARALAARGAQVLMCLGAKPPATLDTADFQVHQLPHVLATDATFRDLRGEDGEPYAELQPRRRAAFSAALQGFLPSMVLVESFPLGRNMMAGEVEPVLIDWRAQAERSCIVASVRDVLARKAPGRAAAMVARANRLTDAVLCHGDPAFVPLEASFPAIAALTVPLVYTGYVDAGALPRRCEDAAGEIVVSTGGGRSAEGLVRLAVGAARLGDPNRRWRVLSADPDAVRAGLGEGLPGNMVLEQNRPDFRALLTGAALSVSQAGYNTVLDVMAAGCRAVFVPFQDEGETEQADRAHALAARGLAAMVPANAPPEALDDAVAAALDRPAPDRPPIDLAGADRSAALLIAAAQAVRVGRAPTWV